MSNNTKIPIIRFSEFNDSWVQSTIGNVAKIFDGTHQTPKYVKSGVPFVSVENINNIEGTDKYITKEAFEKDYKIKPQKDDILMTRITAGIIGATSIVKNDNPLGFYVSLALIRKSNNEVDVKYLEQFINGEIFRKELHKRIIHIAFPKKINLGEISHCRISYPQLPEQQKIASFLTAVDSKIELLQKKKKGLAQYKKGVMQQIFSQKLRFKPALSEVEGDEKGNNYPDWEEKKLGEIGSIITGKTPSTTDKSLWGGEIQFITPTDIEDEKKYQYKTQRTVTINDKLNILPKGSIIYTCIASIGKMILSVNPCITNQQINSLVPNTEYNNEFVYYSLLKITPKIKSTQSTTTLPIINKTEFSKFKIKTPCLEEQTQIANFLSAIDDKIALVNTQLENTQQFKKGLLQQMFV